MISKIQTLEHVKTFAKQLIEEGVSFHPDDDFNDIINLETQELTYTPVEAMEMNELISQCFNICETEGVDIYDILLEVTLAETGLDKIIPLPSQSYSSIK